MVMAQSKRSQSRFRPFWLSQRKKGNISWNGHSDSLTGSTHIWNFPISKSLFTPRTVGWRARKQQFSRILHLSRLREAALGWVVERHAVTSAGNARVRALARSSYFLPKRAVTVWVFTANDFPSVNQLEGMNSLSFGSPIRGHPIYWLPELRHYCHI